MQTGLYEPVIGLEIHIQSKTLSKMFCGCDARYFQSDPNTHTCPVCLGLPGALPVPNKAAINYCVKLAIALNCKINENTKFDRKNYFYPDLPKGFQISQYDSPIGHTGNMEIPSPSGNKTVRITRVHQEEDTGKSIHENGETYLDYNKSGVPLIEVVTEPDFNNKEDVTTFAKRLRQIVRYLDISNADMEKGEMRFELNISVKSSSTKELPNYKVEVKNIGSISVLEKVIELEIERQSEILESGQTPIQETRGLIDMSGKTASQRTKEAEAGYRYFPEPDIPLIELNKAYVERIKAEIIELPNEKLARYINKLNIDRDIAENIISDPETYQAFEQAISKIDNTIVPLFAKWYAVEYFSLDQAQKHNDFKLEWLTEIIKKVEQREITRTSGKEVLLASFTTGVMPDKIIEEKGLRVISDSNELESEAQRVLEGNPKAVSDYQKNPNVLMFLVGQVMKAMGGKADVKIVTEIVKSKLKSNG
ncbi:Asp-tRNA(Asn)/Glu-tRNA(Gln) amidotransferase subunit GatB [bacterium]|nr:Asp-tRNA(Asn)/Glu-tRNA(Gln) amidotransferase subunit GatB [bacterium]